MLPVSTNILDQLLGGFETKPFGSTGTPGQPTENGTGGLLFGELLAQLTGGIDTASETLKNQIINNLFPSIDQPAAQDGAPAGLTVYSTSLIEIGSVQPQLSAADLAKSADADATLSSNRLSLATSPLALAELTPLSIKEGGNNLLWSRSAEIQPGVYNIIDARVEGGQVEMTAIAEGQSAEPVRISVPLAVVQQALAEKLLSGGLLQLRPGSGELSGMTAKPTVAQLDQLLRNLNLKTLEISESVEISAPKAALTGLEITLTAENNGARIAITTKLSRQNVQFLPAGDRGAGIVEEPGISKTVTEAESQQSDSFARQQEQETSGSLKKALVDARFNLSERLMSSLKLDGSESGLMSTESKADASLTNSQTISRQVTLPAVRLTLPDALPKSFSGHGQTIMLRIEPDHLGPARLTLSVRDQILTARVTVESPVAKLAVERSLDQLTDQLSRAGIDVDRIDVTLGGETGREQFFDRRSMWSHARKLRNMNEDDRFESDIAAMPALTMRPLRQYVGAHGVNVLA